MKIIENWDIDELHDILLEVDAGWFRFMLQNFKDWNTDVVKNLIDSFSIKDIAKIIENEDVDGYDDNFDRLPGLFIQLKKFGWNKLRGLLDYYGSDYFINYLYDESEFYGNNLIDLLLEILNKQFHTSIIDL